MMNVFATGFMVVAVLATVVGWYAVGRWRYWRAVARRETANARDLAARLNAAFGRALNAEEDLREVRAANDGLAAALEERSQRLAAIAGVARRRPPRRRWLAFLHRAARIAGGASC